MSSEKNKFEGNSLVQRNNVRRLGDLLKLVVDNRGKTPPLSNSGEFPLVEVNAIVGNKKNPDLDVISKYVDSETYKNWFRKGHPERGDVLFSTVGSIGEVAFVSQETICIAQNIVSLRPNPDLIEGEFLYYLLSSKKTKSAILSLDISSVQPSIKLPHLLDLMVEVPDIEVQKEVSRSLAKLDRKIELNHQTNQTLEQIAQALFKSWFVDFEPTRAKIAAKEAGASPEEIERAAMCAISGKTPDQLTQLPPETQQNLKATSALFPDALVDSELGEIPEGWSVGRIGDIAAAKGGYAFKSNAFIPAGNPVVKIKNIVGDGRVDLIDTDCIDGLEAKKAERFKLNSGDLIMAMTGATVGKTGLVVTNGLPVYLNQRVAKFESELFGSKISWFLYCCFQRDVIFDLVVGAAHGSAQPNISSSGIESTQLILPGEKLIRLFCETTNSFFEKWMANISENNVTENLRNELLPKLLSGELSISEEPE